MVLSTSPCGAGSSDSSSNSMAFVTSWTEHANSMVSINQILRHGERLELRSVGTVWRRRQESCRVGLPKNCFRDSVQSITNDTYQIEKLCSPWRPGLALHCFRRLLGPLSQLQRAIPNPNQSQNSLVARLQPFGPRRGACWLSKCAKGTVCERSALR